jgi:hypothetical protein
VQGLEEERAELMPRAQQMDAQLGVEPLAAPAPQPHAEEALCVVCTDERKQHAIVPCVHMCVRPAAAGCADGGSVPSVPHARRERTTRVRITEGREC